MATQMQNTRLVRILAKNCREVEDGKYECDMDTKMLSNVMAVALKTLTFRNNQYNIWSATGKHPERANDTFSFSIQGNAVDVRIPADGFYTTVEILALLKPLIQAQLDIHAPGATVDSFVVGLYSKKPEITVTGANMLYSDQVPSPNAGTLNTFIGNVESTGLIPSGQAALFSGFADLAGLKSVTVSLKSKSPKTILNKSVSKPLHTNSLGVVPVTVPFGILQTFSQPDLDAARVVFSFPETMTKLQISVRDPQGHLLGDNVNDILAEFMVWFIN